MNRHTFLLFSPCVRLPRPKHADFGFASRPKAVASLARHRKADIDDAKQNVRKRYPDCEFLSSEEIG